MEFTKCISVHNDMHNCHQNLADFSQLFLRYECDHPSKTNAVSNPETSTVLGLLTVAF